MFLDISQQRMHMKTIRFLKIFVKIPQNHHILEVKGKEKTNKIQYSIDLKAQVRVVITSPFISLVTCLG